jgi:hypothetical protein
MEMLIRRIKKIEENSQAVVYLKYFKALIRNFTQNMCGGKSEAVRKPKKKKNEW